MVRFRGAGAPPQFSGSLVALHCFGSVGANGAVSLARELLMDGMEDYFYRNSNIAGNACYVVINGKGGGIQLFQTWPETLAQSSSNWAQFGFKSGIDGVYAVASFIHGHTADLSQIMGTLSANLPNPSRATWASYCARPGYIPNSFPPIPKRQKKKPGALTAPRVGLPSDPTRKRALSYSGPTGLSPEKLRARLERLEPPLLDAPAPPLGPASFLPTTVVGKGPLNPSSSSSTPALPHQGEHPHARSGPGYQHSTEAEAASVLGMVGELIPLRGSPAALLGPGADAPRGCQDGGEGGSPPSV